MLRNYIKISLRNLWRHKFYGAVNILGFSIGLTVVFLITLFVADELSFDRFHRKKDSLYRVVENQYYSGQPVFPVAVTPIALGPSLKEEYPEIVEFTRISGSSDRFRYRQKEFTEGSGAFVDPGFLKMFSFDLIEGDGEMALSQPNSIILTKKLAKKYFGEEEALGKLITLNEDEVLKVTGIMEDFPENSHLYYSYIMPFERLLSFIPNQRDDWDSNRLYTYVELNPDIDPEKVNRKIIGQIKKYNEGSVTDIYLQPLTNVYLGEVDFTVEVSRKGEMQYVQIFSIIAAFILIIACINYMNLSTAQSARRAREVGIRKTVGAVRMQVIIQFLCESVLVSALAVAVAVLFSYLLLPVFNQLAGKQLNLDIFGYGNAGFPIFAVIIITAIIAGLIAGSYPAFFLSSFKPVKVLTTSVASHGKGSMFRKVLVVVQFTVSILLIIGTLIVYNQVSFIQSKNLGYDRDNILMIRGQSENYEAFVNRLKQDPNVIDIGASNRHPAYVLSSTSGFGWPGKDPESTILIHFMGVNKDYMAAMKMAMDHGQYFSEGDSLSIIINQEAKRIMDLEDPIGQIVTQGSRELKIKGVVQDFHFKSIHTEIEPLIVYLVDNLYYTFIRIEPKASEAVISSLETVWGELNPERELDYSFLDMEFDNLYRTESRTGKLFTYFSILAIFISGLGLFGLVSYATEQRTKEIGIRKILGASVKTIFILISKEFTHLILLSFAISIPMGWYLMSRWLDNFAYKINITFEIFLIAGFSALVIALLTVSYQSITAALSNPVKALRRE